MDGGEEESHDSASERRCPWTKLEVYQAFEALIIKDKSSEVPFSYYWVTLIQGLRPNV